MLLINKILFVNFASADDLSICFDIEKEIIKVVFQNTV